MSNDDFKPRLGHIRDDGRAKAIRHSTRVIGEAARNAARPLRRNGHIDPNAHRRGLAHGAISASGLFTPGARRVIVKARYSRLTGGNIGPAQAHLRYVLRDGTTREGTPGRLYDAGGDDADAHAFLERSENDPHQFRFIVAPEDGARLCDLKPVMRDLMRQVEQDLGTQLDWVAVDHFNTGHPHTHVVVRGRDMQNRDLVMARDYISHGIRARAQDLVTLELGPETELERLGKLGNEVGQERLTRLDRALFVRAKDNVLVLTAHDEADAARHTMRVGRLRTLERMGLAAEKQAGVWALDPEIEAKLRRLGDRADKIKMMQRALTEAGVERTPGSYALFDRGSRRHPLTGKVIGAGMIDEITDRTWTVVDGIDGRVHYVELGRLTPDKALRRGDVVRISADRLDGKPQAAPRISVLSRTQAESLPGYDGPTWLDRIVATGDPTMQPRGGFGGEAARDLEVRRQWLISQDLGRTTADGRFELRPSAPAQLRQRELQRIAAEIGRAANVEVRISRPGERVTGVYERAIDTPTGRHAVLRRQDTITIAPWTAALEPMRGRAVTGLVQPGKVAWTLDRGRALSGHVR